MFNPSQSDVRNFFFTVFEKAQAKYDLTDLEKIAYSVILEHPEYHEVLKNRKKYFEYQWTVEMGNTNPFLHLSMHMTLVEQLSIDQPRGIRELYNEMRLKFKDEHEVNHEVVECLGEMLWQAQTNKQMPDGEIYLNCIKRKLDKL